LYARAHALAPKGSSIGSGVRRELVDEVVLRTEAEAVAALSWKQLQILAATPMTESTSIESSSSTSRSLR
jgi:hypothetical protein